MAKPNFTRHVKRRRGGANFWDHEYGTGETLALSTAPSGDLLSFLRFLEKESGRTLLNPTRSALDIGCGNGRNLIHLAKTYGMRGVGYDISTTAITQAKAHAEGLPLSFMTHSVSDPIPLPDESEHIVLDLMVSHVLEKESRARLFADIHRVLKPGGWLYLKTFLLDEDIHAARLLKERPGPQEYSYIHPVINTPEYVFPEELTVDLVSQYFTIHKILRSHRHLRKGGPGKRRSLSLYLQKTD